VPPEKDLEPPDEPPENDRDPPPPEKDRDPPPPPEKDRDPPPPPEKDLEPPPPLDPPPREPPLERDWALASGAAAIRKSVERARMPSSAWTERSVFMAGSSHGKFRCISL